jgi:linoleoyl-CoA desaturase
MSQFQPLRFAKTRPDFYSTLNKRVNDYFKSNNICKHANAEMKIKTVFMISLYWVPYILMMSGLFTSAWAMLGLCVAMGMGLAGIGLSVMHDACHGSYSANPLVNKWLGYTLNMMGATAFNWKVQHNVLHHTYTNVHEHDEDVSQRGLFRLNPHADWKPVHRFQHVYAWFMYGLMTFVWVFFKDFVRMKKYQDNGLVERVKGSAREEWTILIVTKVIYFTYALVLPVIFLPYSFGQIFLGFFVMHYVAGFILAIIFQPAHVTSDSEFPMPDEELTLENNFAIHQIITTKNFANKNFLFSWYVGGLNFQIEHHLFPTVCHVHHRHLAPIVKATAEEYGLPYFHEETFFKAVLEHGRSLQKFGKKPEAVDVIIEEELHAAA